MAAGDGPIHRPLVLPEPADPGRAKLVIRSTYHGFYWPRNDVSLVGGCNHHWGLNPIQQLAVHPVKLADVSPMELAKEGGESGWRLQRRATK